MKEGRSCGFRPSCSLCEDGVSGVAIPAVSVSIFNAAYGPLAVGNMLAGPWIFVADG